MAESSAHLVEHVEGEQREAQVVDHHGSSAGERLPVLHVLGPHPHDQEVDERQHKGWWVMVQQQQASHPLIWTQTRGRGSGIVGRDGSDCLVEGPGPTPEADSPLGPSQDSK